MRIAFITRATLYSVHGGDTVQVIQTALQLRNLEIKVDVKLTNEDIDYSEYDLLHFFNVTRPADILFHIKKAGTVPFVITPNLVDYSEYDKNHRTGISGMALRYFSTNTAEYVKGIARWIKGTDQLKSRGYILRGHKRSTSDVLKRASMILPNTDMELNHLANRFDISPRYSKVHNGIDTDIFGYKGTLKKNNRIILCVARIEGIKNQLNLIRALNNTPFQLIIIGSPAPNQISYYRKCKKIAAENITFKDQMSHSQLAYYYQISKVHILPSWFETCGLASIEAAAMGCNIVITDKGFAKEYFEELAFYCDPSSPASIRTAIEQASTSDYNEELRKKILERYTWKLAAEKTLLAYKLILNEA